MRKFILALAAAFTLFLTAQVPVYATNGSEINPNRPRYSDGQPAENRSDLGWREYILQGTTVPQVVNDGPGWWGGFWASTGSTYVDYARAIDSDTAGSWSLTSNNAFALGQNIYATPESTSAVTAVPVFFQHPLWFNSGLTVWKSTSTTTGSPHKVIFFWQKNSHIGR